MALTGKTGADAIDKYHRLICGVLLRYNSKFRKVAQDAATAGVITNTQRDLILAMVDGSTALCAALDLVAGYSNVN